MPLNTSNQHLGFSKKRQKCTIFGSSIRVQWRIQDFPQGGAPTPKIAIIFQIFAENCMKMKEFGPPGARIPGTPPPWIRQWSVATIKLLRQPQPVTKKGI